MKKLTLIADVQDIGLDGEGHVWCNVLITYKTIDGRRKSKVHSFDVTKEVDVTR